MQFDNSVLSRFLLSCFLMLGLTNEVKADAKWELGIGAGHLTTNAYVGSSEQTALTTPVPFIKLQTDWFDLSEGSLKMKWFEGTPFRLSFNFDLGLPVESKDIKVREGMADLASVLQVGPLLSYELKSKSVLSWKIELPLLFAFAMDDSLKETGWTFTPRVAMRYLVKKGKAPIDLELSLGPVYGAKKYHQYYYSVNQADVMANRSAYDAKGGYAGYRLNMSLTKRIDHLWLGAYMRYQNLDGAEFSDSPLVEQKDYWLVTFAVSYIFESNR